MKRPNQIALTLPPALLADVQEVADAESIYGGNRSALIVDALRHFIAAKKARCAKCGAYSIIAGRSPDGPLCGDCF